MRGGTYDRRSLAHPLAATEEDGDAMSITGLEFSERTGVPLEALAEWEALGLVPRDEAGAFGEEAAERVRLLRYLTDCGVEAAAVARVSQAEGDLLARWAHWFGPPRPVGRTLDEAADEVGIDGDLMERLWVAAGLGDQIEVFDDDVQMLRTLAAALEVGVSEDMLVQLVRVSADALGRVADTEVRLFHFHVHERLRGEGLAGEELEDQVHAIGEALIDAVEPTVLYWHRKGWQRALRDDMLLHVTEDLEPDADGLARVPVAVLFADLASFTPLTEAMGDEVAAGIVDRFSQLVRRAAADHHGRVLKQIGDEFMVVFPSADAAVACGLALVRSVSDQTEFPGLRIGTHVGPALYREGDYLGSSVNIAARVTAEAERGQFLATRAVRDAADAPDARWHPLSDSSLEGVSDPIQLFEIRSSQEVIERPTDPVCGMHIDPTDAEAIARWSGDEFHFCSRSCFQRFAEAPNRYAARTTAGRGA